MSSIEDSQDIDLSLFSHAPWPYRNLTNQQTVLFEAFRSISPRRRVEKLAGKLMLLGFGGFLFGAGDTIYEEKPLAISQTDTKIAIGGFVLLFASTWLGTKALAKNAPLIEADFSEAMGIPEITTPIYEEPTLPEPIHTYFRPKTALSDWTLEENELEFTLAPRAQQ